MQSTKLASILRCAKVFIRKHYFLCGWVLSSLFMALMLLCNWWKYANVLERTVIGSCTILALLPTAIAIMRSECQRRHRKSKQVMICASDEKMLMLASAIGVRLLQSWFLSYIDTINPSSELRRTKLIREVVNNSYIILLISPDYLRVANHRDWVRQIVECAVSYEIDVIPVIAQENPSIAVQTSYMGNMKFCHPIGIDSDDIATTEMSEIFNIAEHIHDRLNILDDEQYRYYYILSLLGINFFQ